MSSLAKPASPVMILAIVFLSLLFVLKDKENLFPSTFGIMILASSVNSLHFVFCMPFC